MFLKKNKQKKQSFGCINNKNIDVQKPVLEHESIHSDMSEPIRLNEQSKDKIWHTSHWAVFLHEPWTAAANLNVS